MKRRNSNSVHRIVLFASVLLVSVGCDDSGESGEAGGAMAMGGSAMGGSAMGGSAMGGAEVPSQMEIRGVFTDNWDGGHEITIESWTQAGEMPSVTTFTVVDNDEGFVVGQNASDHPFSPDLWSRFDWTFDATGLHYCQIAYDAADEQTALDADGADATDLEAGCNENPWSQLSPTTAPELVGSYTDGFSPHVIEAQRWIQGEGDMVSHFIFTVVDNEADFAIARNDDANPFSPSLWSRFDWIDNGDGTFFYCQAPHNGASADVAHGAMSDRGDPENAGCGMFSWSALTAP